jgi:hypothetical protein
MFDVRDLIQHPPRFNVNDTVYFVHKGRVFEGKVIEFLSANGNYDVNDINEHIDLDAYNIVWEDGWCKKHEDWIHSYELLTEDQADEKKENLEYYYDNRD